MKFFFVINYSLNKAMKTAKEAIKILNELNCECAVDGTQNNLLNKLNGLAKSSNQNLNSFDLIISVGGDGTVISAAKLAIKHNLPILGINAGHMGFLCGIESNELEKLKQLTSKSYFLKQRMLLDVNYEQQHWIAINDAVVTKPTLHGFVNLKIYDKNKFIIKYRADSVLFSTPTGSTAYSLSNGGPIADPNLSFIAMAPICAHSLISRTSLFSETSVLNVEVGDESEACLVLDGIVVKLLKQNSTIQIKRSEKKLKLIYLKDINFFELVKNKFF